LGKFTFQEAAVKKDKKLSAIFKKHQLRGGLFGKGMYDDLVGEGWDDPRDIREQYKPVGEKKERLIDGVIMVTSTLEPDMIEKVKSVKEHFLKEPSSDLDNYTVSNDPVIEFPLVRVGRTLPGAKEQ
jgi:hypothetical protein